MGAGSQFPQSNSSVTNASPEPPLSLAPEDRASIAAPTFASVTPISNLTF